MFKRSLIALLFSIILLFNLACGDGGSNYTPPPTPANVVISDTNAGYEWWGTIGRMIVSGVATNTGEKTAYYVQIRIKLFDNNRNLISTSTWYTIFDSLSGGASRGFNAQWWYEDQRLGNASRYSIEVIWSINPLSSDSEDLINSTQIIPLFPE